MLKPFTSVVDAKRLFRGVELYRIAALGVPGGGRAESAGFVRLFFRERALVESIFGASVWKFAEVGRFRQTSKNRDDERRVLSCSFSIP